MQSSVYYNSRQLKQNIVNVPRLDNLSKVLNWSEEMEDEIAAECESHIHEPEEEKSEQ